MFRGASPPGAPLHARSRGPRRPAPLAWLTRFARSHPAHGLCSRGLRPPEPPYTLARGDPAAPLRSRGSLASLVPILLTGYVPGGFAPGAPLHARSRGPRRPAPLAWLTRFARSHPAHGLCSRGLRPPSPPTARSRGPRRPAPLAWLTRFARSILLTGYVPGGFAPPEPLYTLARGDPAAPAPLAWLTLASLVPILLTGYVPGGFAPRSPPTRSLAGTPPPRSARVPAHGLRVFHVPHEVTWDPSDGAVIGDVFVLY